MEIFRYIKTITKRSIQNIFYLQFHVLLIEGIKKYFVSLLQFKIIIYSLSGTC